MVFKAKIANGFSILLYLCDLSNQKLLIRHISCTIYRFLHLTSIDMLSLFFYICVIFFLIFYFISDTVKSKLKLLCSTKFRIHLSINFHCCLLACLPFDDRTTTTAMSKSKKRFFFSLL